MTYYIDFNLAEDDKVMSERAGLLLYR